MLRKNELDNLTRKSESSSTTSSEIAASISVNEPVVEANGSYDDDENVSVISDLKSIASGQKSLSTSSFQRKCLATIHRLKSENVALKEALIGSQKNDITLLKTKCRGYQADIMRLRQHNNELKDRIQSLEDRIITNSVPTRDDTSNKVDVTKGISTSLHFSNDKNTLTEAKVIKSLDSRCKHLSKLVQSYENRIVAMQTEIDKYESIKNSTPSELTVDESMIPTKKLSFDEIYGKQIDVNHQHDSIPSSNHPNASSSDPNSSSNHFNLNSQNKSSTMKVMPLGKNRKVDVNKLMRKQSNLNQMMNEMDKEKMDLIGEELSQMIASLRSNDRKFIEELSNEIKRLLTFIPQDQRDNLDDELIPHQDDDDVNLKDNALKNNSNSSITTQQMDDNIDALEKIKPAERNYYQKDYLFAIFGLMIGIVLTRLIKMYYT